MMLTEIPAVVASITVLIVTFVLMILVEKIQKKGLIRHIAIVGLLAALLVLPFFPTDGLALPILRTDGLAIFFSVIFLVIGLAVVLASKEKHVAYYTSIILTIMGMMLAASAKDLLMLYLSIELVTVPSYALVAFGKKKAGLEALTKYFIVSLVASVLLLLATILLAMSAGQTSLTDFVPTLNGFFFLGVGAFLAGLGFKLGIFPFNLWIPDVYQGSPPEIAGLLAAAAKKAAFVAFFPVAIVFAKYVNSWSLILAILAALTMTIPNIIALQQSDLRRMLAYSIMTHAGYLLMGVAIGTHAGFAATSVHAFTHAFMAFGALLVAGVFASRKYFRIEQLRGAGFRDPLLVISLTVFLLSLAGIPLLAGFASKFYLFYVVYVQGMGWLTMLAIANSALALYYYFKVIRAMYGYSSAGTSHRVRYGALVSIIICLFAIIFFGLYPVPVIDLASFAVSGII